jgi:hypothetical protein
MIALQLDNSTGYRILGILHIASVMVAFGPLLLYPTLRRAGATAEMAKLHMRVTLPALVLLWVFGMGMAGVGELEMSEPWLTSSIVVWVALLAISWFLIRPAIADTGEEARSRLAMGTGITHLLMLVALYLMIFKPGL